MIARIAVALTAVMLASAAMATGVTRWPTGPLPIEIEPPHPVTFAPGDRIIIEGTVTDGPATLVLRIDDRRTPAYPDRVNAERELPPGPFRIDLTAATLRTTAGRPLDLATIHRVIFFATDDTRKITVHRFERVPGPPPPAGATAPRATGAALSFGTGPAPITYRPSRPIDARGRQLLIEGTNRASDIQTVVLRLDDGASAGYASRVNVEREVPPGPFRLRLPVDGLTTPDKRVIDAADLRLVILTPWPENDRIAVSRFDLAPIERLPEGTVAVALGAADAPLPPGFERIAPGDPRLAGRHLQARRRPAPDPLISNGIRGIESLTLKTRPGAKRVTVWSEDPGEWEHLPAVLDQSIRVNGVPVSRVKRSYPEWLQQRYLAQRWHEHGRDSDAFEAYGRHRGNPHTINVDAPDGEVRIEVAGDTLDDRYISAVLVEPAGDTRALEQVSADRAGWYRDNFPVAPAPAGALPSANAGNEVALTWNPDREPHRTTPPVRLRLAPGTGARLTLTLTTGKSITRPRIVLTPPGAGNPAGLSLEAWAAQWRLDRTEPQDTRLEWRDDRLVADLDRLPLIPDRPRRYELWLSAPPTATAGRYSARFDISNSSATTPRLTVPLDIEVLPVSLPPVAKPVGPYLAYAPHLTWHTTLEDRDRQAVCDLARLERFGLTGTAPPVATPLSGGLVPFLAEMKRARTAGVSPGFLLYNPLHQMRLALGTDRAARFAGAAAEALARAKTAPPVWSAADEPSNPDQDQGNLAQWVQALRQRSPVPIRLAGHLNSPADAAYARLFDVVIINPGFGLDRNQVSTLSADGRDVWIYNTFAPRLTAGVWLHYSSALRYVQWHARMPTAAPLDPIDGREGDVQLLYPMDRICADRTDIHRNLLRLAEGVVDQRWLLWLAARTDAAARRLRQDLSAAIPDRWQAASSLTDKHLDDIRQRIIDLAATAPR